MTRARALGRRSPRSRPASARCRCSATARSRPGRFDLGNMVRPSGRRRTATSSRSTDLRGEQISRLGAHFDPILAALRAALVALAEPDAAARRPGGRDRARRAAGVLARAQAPRLRAGRRSASRSRTSLYPPTQWLALNEFHPVALACPLLLFAFWYLDEDRLVPFARRRRGVAMPDEGDVGLVVAGLGLWYALAHGRRASRARDRAAGTAARVIAIVVSPHFARSCRTSRAATSTSAARRRGRDDVADPLDALADASTTRPALPVRARCCRSRAAAAAPLARGACRELALNLLSATRTQTSIHFHYTAAAIPALIAAAVLGAARLRPRGSPVVDVTGGARRRVIANYVLGADPVWRASPEARRSARATVVTAHDRVAARALRSIPADAVVSATNSLGAHCRRGGASSASRCSSDATWIAVDERAPGYADRLAPLARRRRAAPVAAARPALAARLRAGRRCSSSGALPLERNRLPQQVGAEREREQLRAAVVLRGRERHRPDDVPGRRATAWSRAAARSREAEPRASAPGLARKPGERRPRRRRPRARARAVRQAELLEPVRQRVARLLVGVPRERPERAQPVDAVAPGREPRRRATAAAANPRCPTRRRLARASSARERKQDERDPLHEHRERPGDSRELPPPDAPRAERAERRAPITARRCGRRRRSARRAAGSSRRTRRRSGARASRAASTAAPSTPTAASAL